MGFSCGVLRFINEALSTEKSYHVAISILFTAVDRVCPWGWFGEWRTSSFPLFFSAPKGGS